jgi:hypothetical protein
MTQPCIQEENIGKFKEFMESSKGLKATMFTIALTILLQVGTFLYLWGGLVTTVRYHDENIKKIFTKLDNVKLVGYVYGKDTVKE